MQKSVNALLLLSLALIIVGCQTTDDSVAGGKKAGLEVDQRDDETHIGPPIESVRDMMRAKLAHGHGVLEGLARKNYDQIVANAKSLHDLASKEAWGVHRTMEYNLYSDQFRWHTRELRRHAEEKKLHAATMDYMQMVMTCVRCHDYMDQENLILDQSYDLSRFLARVDG